MSAKNSRTTADPLDWKVAHVLIKKLEADGKIREAMLIGAGIFLGLRASDLREITWEDLQGSTINLIEGKTRKFRKLTIHPELKEIAARNCNGRTGPVFSNGRDGGILTIQALNRMLHQIGKQYKVEGNFSTHSLRKGFSKRVFEKNGESDRSLIILSEILNHSNLAVTKRYIGLRQTEVDNIYLTL